MWCQSLDIEQNVKRKWCLLRPTQPPTLSFLSHPLGDLEVKYALHLLLVGKPMVDFLFVITELLRLKRYKMKSVEVDVIRRGVGHFEHKFQTEGGVAHQLLLV